MSAASPTPAEPANSARLGQEQYCLNGNVQTYAGRDVDGTITQGGYSEATVVDEHFVLSDARGLDPSRSAPLLCAGITLYSPLRHWEVGPGIAGGDRRNGRPRARRREDRPRTRRGRHRAVAGPVEEGRRAGVRRQGRTTPPAIPATFEQLAGQFDLIINTVSAPLDITAYLRLLTVDGTLVNVGAPVQPQGVEALALITHRRSFAGSANGGIAETQEMLDFCAEHGILPETELIGFDQRERGLRAGALLGRPLPLRHRHRVPARHPATGRLAR